MKEVCDKKSCTGCHACYNICPRGCITMEQDEFGFFSPNIEQKLCINCGKCKRICPAVNNVECHKPIGVYAAINKNSKDYLEATSGGIATLLSREIVSKGGVVYGAACCENLKIKHIRVDNMKDIDKLKGSKYVQSLIEDSYKNILDDLNNAKNVLFVGAPCQVAGLYNFLGRKYEKLLTCDIVCHGTPPLKLLKEHLNHVKIYNGTNILFRTEKGFYLKVLDGNNSIYQKKNFFDIYYIGFLKGLYYNEVCYDCKYANCERVGDITLGDFWGFNNAHEFVVKHDNGLSMVMINTEKGKKVFNKLESKMYVQKRTIEEAVAGNKQLRQPSLKHKNYEKFKREYKVYGFEKAAKKALWKERIAYSIIDKISK